MPIKVFGIQRSGTNYMSYLVGANIKRNKLFLFLNDLGWKHDFVPQNYTLSKILRYEIGCKAIIIIKNPYTWYTSIENWIRRSKRKDWKFPSYGPEQVFKRYNTLYKGHKDFLDHKYRNTVYMDSILVRYEDLITDTKYEMEKISDKFCVGLQNLFKNTTRIPQSHQFTEVRRKYYMEQVPDYGDEMISRVNSSVDWGLMEFYGYEKIGKGD